MTKIWEKTYKLDKEIEAFTVGDDYITDTLLVRYDALASAAHAKTLYKEKILSSKELGSLLKGLSKIHSLSLQGKFVIKQENEDMHAAIENWLTKNIGKAGAKIHTARSRNDQVLAAIRLYTKDMMLQVASETIALCEELMRFSKQHSDTEMPGYTHMQRAMPSTVSLWSSALLEALLDDLALLKTAFDLNNQSPLGSGSGYGIPIKIDRTVAATMLGFDKVQNNSLYVQNSRGKIETAIISVLSQIMLDLSRCAHDLLLFTMVEFGFFSLPDEFLTGSSMMPQKKNYDVLELVRGKYSEVIASETVLRSLVAKLPSGYNRDMQLTKKPIISSLETTRDSIAIMKLVFSKLRVHDEKLKNALTPDIYATHAAYGMLGKKSFRDAYKEAGKNKTSTVARPQIINLKPATQTLAHMKKYYESLKATMPTKKIFSLP